MIFVDIPKSSTLTSVTALERVENVLLASPFSEKKKTFKSEILIVSFFV